MNIIYQNKSALKKYDYLKRFRNTNEEILKKIFLQSETKTLNKTTTKEHLSTLYY